MFVVGLKRTHRRLFLFEVGVTSVWILGSLKKLEKNPSDRNEIESLLSYADRSTSAIRVDDI